MYSICKSTGEIRFPDGFILPPPYENPRYSEYADWVLQGNSPEEIEPVFDIVVTTYQAKAALELAGKYDEVEAFIALDTTDRITKLKWEYKDFKRSDPAVIEIGKALRMTDKELDDLFRLAATIE